MCGIAGIFDIRGERRFDPRLLARMTDAMAHRGPDDSGYHVVPGLGLGHRRLSIIDLSPSGHQPLFNEDDTVCVVFNGEIYNFRDLFSQLVALGHKFRSRCDTEVIVHAWEEWGENCVDRFQGMFGFAIWDEKQQKLFLARDRFGEKPLYYAFLDNGCFVFASELKGILQHPELRREIDPRSVADYFAYGYVPDPRTIYRQVAKLPPGHSLVVRRGKAVPTARQYWDLKFAQHNRRLNEPLLCSELIDRIRRTVALRMIADVPLGAFLSGGVDSSAVVAMMAGLSNEPVNTCSISFADASYDESRYAQMVANQYSTNHFTQRVAADDFALIDRLATLYDEPFADSSALPTYLVCALARQRVTVALSGDGGDEIFAGYRRYYWHQHEESVRSLLPIALREPIFGLFGMLYPKMDWAPRLFRAKATLQNLARNTVEAYFNSVTFTPASVYGRLFSEMQWRELQDYQPIDILKEHMGRAQTEDCLSQIQYADLKTYLPGDILTKVDRASMAHSLEVRVPLLDHDLVEWLATLPSNLKLKGREGKYIFKKALEPFLPQEVLYRPKMGFAVPLRSWFRGPLREHVRKTVSTGKVAESGFFNVPYLRALVDQHQSGAFDHSTVIWALIMFEAFLKNVHHTDARHTRMPPDFASEAVK